MARGLLTHVERVQQKGAQTVAEVKPGLDPKTQSVISVRDPLQTETYTLFTTVIGPSQLFLSVESWVKVTLRLETAGPVAVGTRQEISPVLGGSGALVSGEDLVLELGKGNRLYYAAESINRIRVIVAPVPYGGSIVRNQELGYDRIVQGLVDVRDAIATRVGSVVKQVVAAPPRSAGRLQIRGKKR